MTFLCVPKIDIKATMNRLKSSHPRGPGPTEAQWSFPNESLFPRRCVQVGHRIYWYSTLSLQTVHKDGHALVLVTL
jgi:hypothetical protein